MMRRSIIHVVLDETLLGAADRTARRHKLNRSALIRDALREHLKRLRTYERERMDREGYEKFPDDEFAAWDRVTSWPDIHGRRGRQ
jgi:metal-responsive CopG/Arc/MetJ family transcriptional regulator